MPLNIAIVGGGIGGPASAIGLARQGHTVTLYERSSNALDGVGFAFRITPNSDRCLKFLGIDTRDAGAVEATSGRMMNHDGAVVGEFRENVDRAKAREAASVFAYRPTIQQQLLDATAASGAKIKTGVKVTSVDVENTTLTFDDGSTATTDVIIAADGVHSTIRPYIVDSSIHHPKLSTGHGCLRFTMAKKTVQDDAIASKGVNDNFRLFSWNGEGKRIVVYPVDYDRLYNFNCTHPEAMSAVETAGDEKGNAEAVAYNQKISPDTVMKIYAEFDPVAVRLLELADPDGFRVWKLLDMDEIPRWSLKRTVLLGDSCHPVVPFGFSGASMAIEDGVTLATLLPADVKLEDVEGRLGLYERIRKPRVAKVRETSRLFGSGVESPQRMQEYREWLGKHDAVEFAKENLREYLKG